MKKAMSINPDVTTRVVAAGLVVSGLLIPAGTANPENVVPQGTIIAVSKQQNIAPATNAVDGIINVAANRWSASGMPQSLLIDLGSIYDVTRFEVFPYKDRAYRYTIEGSVGNGVYATLVDRSQNSTGGNSIADDIPLAAVRYLRLTVTGAAPASYTGSWVSIQEFKCFGVPNTDPQVIDSDLLVTGGTRINAGLDLVTGALGVFKNETLYTAGANPGIELGYNPAGQPLFSLFDGDPAVSSSPGLLIDPANNAATFQNLSIAVTGSLSLNGSSLLTTDNAATALAGNGFLVADGSNGITLTKPVSQGGTNAIAIGHGATPVGNNTTVIGNTGTISTRLHGAANLDSLNVTGATTLQGQVIIAQPQGDISMGAYQ